MLPNDLLGLVDAEMDTACCLLRASEKLFISYPLDVFVQHLLSQRFRRRLQTPGDGDEFIPQRVLDLKINHGVGPLACSDFTGDARCCQSLAERPTRRSP
jgi:hypothetical protein